MATLGYHSETGRHVDPAKSVASIVAIIAAVVSFYLSSQGREMFALLAALVAIGAGFVGGMKALSPRVSGGILSIIAVVLGAIAVVVALIALIV
jgi:hypothetical protein